jgi:hypothetical protein
MIRSRAAASRAPAAPLRGRSAPPDPAARSQEPAAIRAREHSEVRPQTVNGPSRNHLRSRSDAGKRTGFVPHHGRCAPSAVSRTATDGPRQQRFPAYRAPLSRVCWRFGDRVGGVPAPGRRVPVPVGNAGLAVIRRTQPVSVPSRAARAASPRRRPGRNRTPSAGIGPRAAALALTSPARVPAGQQTNIPETFLCMRGVPSMDLARAGDGTGRVLGWRRHGRRTVTWFGRPHR